MREKIIVTILWVFLIIVFCVLAGSVSLVMAGYRLDWQTKRLTQTGLLYIAGSPRQAQVAINGAQVADKLPLRLSAVVPGEYRVVISKEGFIAWHKSFTIKPGEARTETDVRLFYIRPEVSDVTDPALIERVQSNTSLSPLINGQEIRIGASLVTRVSGELKSAALSLDRGHIYFQIGREVRVIEKDGTNELLLFTLSTDEPSQIIALAQDKEIALLDHGVVRRLRISSQ